MTNLSQEIENELNRVNKRRLERDKDILRKGCMDSMRIFKPDCREWILGECKDLLILSEKLSNSQKRPVARKGKLLYSKVKKIHSSYSRRIIPLLTKIENGTSGSRTNLEYCEKLKIALNTAIDVITQLFELRNEVDDLIVDEYDYEFQHSEESPDYIQ